MSLRSLDTFANAFSHSIHQLYEYEQLHRNSNSHKTLFKQLLRELIKRKKFAQDQDLWKELYLRSLAFYRSKTHIGSIPTRLVTKHNEIVSFYMEQEISKTSSTILRFDTHADLNPIQESAYLPVIYQKYLDTKDSKYLRDAQKLVWDIGAAKSGVLFATGIRDLVWGIPQWVPDANVTIKYGIKKNKKNMSLITDDVHAKGMNEWAIQRMKSSLPQRTFSKAQTGRLSKRTLERIIKMIKSNGNEYILDIDLDYFICNGQPFDKSYWKELYDLQSFHRTQTREINEDVPRSKLEKTAELKKYERKLQNEIRQVNQRIKTFFKILKDLKRQGLKPSHITLCDSTNVLFSDCISCNSFSNGYVPLNLALYVHTYVEHYLHKLFA
jgi:hypothetical protein